MFKTNTLTVDVPLNLISFFAIYNFRIKIEIAFGYKFSTGKFNKGVESFYHRWVSLSTKLSMFLRINLSWLENETNTLMLKNVVKSF